VQADEKEKQEGSRGQSGDSCRERSLGSAIPAFFPRRVPHKTLLRTVGERVARKYSSFKGE